MVRVNRTWNGSSWTETADLNAPVSFKGSGSAQHHWLLEDQHNLHLTSALTEVWNGTAWTEQGDLSNARNGIW